MIGCRFFVCALGLSLAILPLAFGTTKSYAASPLAALDKDNDGNLDLAEVKDGANGVFVKLDNDNDTTLDRKEIQGRISRAEFEGADPDGTVDQKELHSKAGRALSRLIH